MKSESKTFKAAYARTGMIWIDEGECDVCKNKITCLLVDSSEDEYGPGRICLECVNEMFQEKERQKNE